MLKLYTTIWWIFSLAATQSTNECPTDWLRRQDSCYSVCFYPTKTYESSKQICQLQRASILSVDNYEEFIFLSDWLTRNDYRRTIQWWTDVANDSRSAVLTSSHYWSDDLTETSKGKAVVFTYSVAGRYKLAWSYPDRLLSFICEVSVKEAYRIPDSDRDHMYGTNISDPQSVRIGPKLIQQPQSVLVVDSRYVEISCEAHGNPGPTYKWLKDSSPLQVTSDDRYMLTNGKLVIREPIDLKDEGRYQCVATNEIGTILSDAGSINFGFLGEFSNDLPGIVTAKLYQGVAINCGLPVYRPAVEVKWYKEDNGPNFLRTDLQPHQFNSNNGKLYFSEVTMSDAGVYHCVASLVSPVGQVMYSAQGLSRTSLGMPLVVTGGAPGDYGPEIQGDFPVIFPTPALRGQTLTIECFAYGELPLYYSWKRESGPVPSKVTYSDHNRVLTISDAQLEDSGNYTCEVRRGNGYMVDKSIHLIVEARPFFTFPLTDKHIDVNQEFVWFCEARGSPAPVYTWYKDGLPLNSRPGQTDVNKNILRIYQAQPSQHQGMYQCAASNAHGTTFTTAQLRVLAFKPSFSRQPVNPSQTVTEGGNITILCRPQAAPKPTLAWRKDGQLLPVSTNDKDRILQLMTGDLFIRHLQISDKGEYQCTASNELGSETSSGLLNVVSQVTMTIVPSDTQAEVNATAFLPCLASFNIMEQDLVYVWDFGGVNVLQLVDPSFKLDYQGSVPGLYIIGVQVHHTGVYGCSAVTVDSSKRHTAYLQVLGPPGEPGGVKAEISGHTATIKWLPGPTNFAKIIKFHVEFNTGFNSGWRTLKGDIFYSDARDAVKTKWCVYEVSGLKPGSSYTFRVVAYNRYGPGTPSLPSPLYKVADSAPITTVGGINSDYWGPVGTLTVGWTLLSEEDLVGSAVGYRIYYRKRSFTDMWHLGKVQGQHSYFSAVIGAENYYLEYEVKVSAFNEFGDGPNSTVQTIMSQGDLPLGVPTNVYVKTYNSTAISVYWTPVPLIREYIRGQIVGYSLNYWMKDGEMDSSNMHCSETCNSALIIGLQPHSYYWVNVQVVNTAGSGTLSENYFGRTWKRAPENYPEYTQVHSYPGNSVFVTWRGVSIGSLEETLQGYKIRWWPITEDIRTAKVKVIPEKLTRAVLHGIKEGVVYSLRVLAYNRGGDGRNSPTVYFTLEGQVMYNPETTEIMNAAPVAMFSKYIATVAIVFNCYILNPCAISRPFT